MKNNQVTKAVLFFASSIIVLVGAMVLASALRVQADSVLTTVPVGTTPQQIHLTPDGSNLFVSNETSNNVSVISTSTDAVIGTIPVGTDPGPIRFTPNGAKAYIANKLSNNVSVIDVAARTETARIPVGTSPVTLAVTLDGSKVYVVNQGSNNVYVISTATDTVIGPPITVGTFPNTTLKTPDGSKLYVANSTSDNVSVISTASDSVVATISVLPSKDPGSIHFLPNGTKGYVANRGCVANGTTCLVSVAPTVSVINVATNGVLSTINVGAVGAAPHAIRITPDGSKLYLINKHGDEVKVINTATVTVATTIPLTSGSCTNIAFGVGSCPVRIELTPDGSKAYVVEERPLAANGVLTIICTGVVPAVCGGASTDTVVGTVALGNSPADIEIMNGIKAYVDNSGSNTVSVVALAVDTDGDGCPDANELQTALGSQLTGGRRDPHNPWDYFNPTHDGVNRADDILYVVRHYRKDQYLPSPPNPPNTPNPQYDPATDRSYIGPNPWNLGPPDGFVTAIDILEIVRQYHHDCS